MFFPPREYRLPSLGSGRKAGLEREEKRGEERRGERGEEREERGERERRKRENRGREVGERELNMWCRQSHRFIL